MSAEFWCGRQCVVIGSYLFLTTIGIATCDILQDIPIAILLYLERHAEFDTLVVGRQGVLEVCL